MTAPLSPAVQAIMVAATNGNSNVVNDPVYKQCIAAALRTVADQVVPPCPGAGRGTGAYEEWMIADDIGHRILAIAAELDPRTEAE